MRGPLLVHVAAGALGVVLWALAALALPELARAGDAPDDPCARGRAALADYEKLYAPEGSPGAGTPRGPSLRHLIALVPDPAFAAQRGSFDTVLEGVEEAIAAGRKGDGGAPIRYVRDRSWSPWPRAGAPLPPERCWRKEPGVIVYRPTLDGPQRPPTYVVLLVGEAPTWGVRVEQLGAALDWVNGARAWEPEGDERVVRILGPSYSGTAPSLAAVLRARRPTVDDPAGQHLRYAIVSGTATVAEVKTELEQQNGQPGAATIAYEATTPTSAEMLDAMIDFLRLRGATCAEPGPGNVVLLTESLTSYGAAQRAGTPYADCGRWFEEIKFPPDLAAIRDAYSGDVEPAAGDPAASPKPPKGNDTPLARSLALAEVLRDLSRRRIRFVGLAATDPHDVVTLAELIRAELPDIRLFTLRGDIRYLDPQLAGVLDGMLVARAAPGPGTPAESVSLANDVVRGVYAAGRRLLGEPRQPPAVQIALVGHGGFWQMGPDGPPGAAQGSPVAPGPSSRRPVGWWFVFVVCVTAFASIFGAIVSPALADRVRRAGWIDLRKTTGFLRHRGFFWTHVGPCEHVDLSADDRFVTAALLFVSACPMLLMIVTWVARDGAFWHVGGARFSVGLTAAVLSAAWARALCAWRKATTSTAVISLAATAAGVAGLGMGCGAQREATFNVMSGGSPVLAGLIGFAMVGIALVCWRVRLRFLDTHRFGVPASEGGEGPRFAAMTPPIAELLGDADDGLAEIERRLLAVIRSPWITFMAVPLLIHVLLALSVAVPLCIKSPQTLEPAWRDKLLVAFGCLAFLPITGNFSRVVATWLLLKRLLGRVASHPAAAALEQGLPAALTRRLSAQLALSGATIEDLTHPLRVLERLVEAKPELAPLLAESRRRMSAELKYEAGDADCDCEGRASTAGADAVATALLKTSSLLMQSRANLDAASRPVADAFAASLLAVFVPRYVRHFRLFVPPVIVGAVLSATMTSLYFVQPARLITSIIFVWVAGMVLTVFAVYTDLDRDVVISGIGKSTAGSVSLDWSLAYRIVSWGLVPLGSLLAAQDPAIGAMLTGFFDTVVKGFR